MNSRLIRARHQNHWSATALGAGLEMGIWEEKRGIWLKAHEL